MSSYSNAGVVSVSGAVPISPILNLDRRNSSFKATGADSRAKTIPAQGTGQGVSRGLPARGNPGDVPRTKSGRTRLPNRPVYLSFSTGRFLITDAPTDALMPVYTDVLLRKHVKHVVRLCEPTYDTTPLENAGINVIDMPFVEDGETAIPRRLVRQWVKFLYEVFPKFGLVDVHGEDANVDDDKDGIDVDNDGKSNNTTAAGKHAAVEISALPLQKNNSKIAPGGSGSGSGSSSRADPCAQCPHCLAKAKHAASASTTDAGNPLLASSHHSSHHSSHRSQSGTHSARISPLPLGADSSLNLSPIAIVPVIDAEAERLSDMQTHGDMATVTSPFVADIENADCVSEPVHNKALNASNSNLRSTLGSSGAGDSVGSFRTLNESSATTVRSSHASSLSSSHSGVNSGTASPRSETSRNARREQDNASSTTSPAIGEMCLSPRSDDMVVSEDTNNKLAITVSEAYGSAPSSPVVSECPKKIIIRAYDPSKAGDQCIGANGAVHNPSPRITRKNAGKVTAAAFHNASISVSRAEHSMVSRHNSSNYLNSAGNGAGAGTMSNMSFNVGSSAYGGSTSGASIYGGSAYNGSVYDSCMMCASVAAQVGYHPPPSIPEGSNEMASASFDAAAPSTATATTAKKNVVGGMKEEEKVTIAVHCVSGVSRAPLLIAIALMEAGFHLDEVLTICRTKKKGSISTAQLEFLLHYHPRGNPSLRAKEKKANAGCCTVM